MKFFQKEPERSRPREKVEWNAKKLQFHSFNIQKLRYGHALGMLHIQTQEILIARQYDVNIIENGGIQDRLVFCIPYQLLCVGSGGD